MIPENQLHVQIGQVRIGRTGTYLHALLGSCIGIGFLLPHKGLYGLAHCLLAASPSPQTQLGARHVDQAIHSLLELMEIRPNERQNVDVFIAGGGIMTRGPEYDPTSQVGCINSQYAKKSLREHRLHIIHEDIGGCNARKVVIDCTTGTFDINIIPRLGAVQ